MTTFQILVNDKSTKLKMSESHFLLSHLRVLLTFHLVCNWPAIKYLIKDNQNLAKLPIYVQNATPTPLQTDTWFDILSVPLNCDMHYAKPSIQTTKSLFVPLYNLKYVRYHFPLYVFW